MGAIVGDELGWSKALFGNQHMLRIASTIGDTDAEFTCQSLSEATGLAGSTVHRSLQQLAAVELIARCPKVRGTRAQNYARRPHVFWDAAKRLWRDSTAGKAMTTSGESLEREGTGSA